MANEHKTLQNRLSGTLGIEEGDEALRQLFDIGVVERLAADGAANSTLANTKLWSNPFSYAVRIVAGSVNADANVAEHADNHATITLLVDDGANGTPVTAASVDSDVGSGGNWTADIDEAMTLTQTNCVVAPGANVFYAQAKGGTGVQLPIRMLKVRFRKEG